jgi:hypothetical protein
MKSWRADAIRASITADQFIFENLLAERPNREISGLIVSRGQWRKPASRRRPAVFSG